MLVFVVAARIGERQHILRFAQLVGIEDDQAVIGEVFTQLVGKSFKCRVVGDGAAAGR